LICPQYRHNINDGILTTDLALDYKNDFEMAFVKENRMIIQNNPFQIEVSAIEVNEREQTKMVETMYNTIELMKCFCFISINNSCFNKWTTCFTNIN